MWARVSPSRPRGELQRLAARRRQDLSNRRRFTSDILSIIEQKRLRSKANDTDEAIAIPQNIVNVEDQEDPYYPHKVTFQEKSPKHEALKKLFDIDLDICTVQLSSHLMLQFSYNIAFAL